MMKKNNEKLSLNKAQETDYLNFINILERTLLYLLKIYCAFILICLLRFVITSSSKISLNYFS